MKIERGVNILWALQQHLSGQVGSACSTERKKEVGTSWSESRKDNTKGGRTKVRKDVSSVNKLLIAWQIIPATLRHELVSRNR